MRQFEITVRASRVGPVRDQLKLGGFTVKYGRYLAGGKRYAIRASHKSTIIDVRTVRAEIMWSGAAIYASVQELDA